MIEEDFRLRVFVTVAQLGSFSAAARELGVSQSAVSQSVAGLERQIGAPVFERSRSSLSITPKGEILLGYAREILHWYEAASRALAGDPDAPTPFEIPLKGDKTAQIWSSGGEIHIKLKED